MILKNISIPAFVFFLIFSCKKEKSKIPEDPRDKYTGKYNCHVNYSTVFLDSTGNVIHRDTNYIMIVGVQKSNVPNGLVLTNFNSNEKLFDVTFEPEPNFSGARVIGYFHKGDSLYIDNSHPTRIYSGIFSGKKFAN